MFSPKLTLYRRYFNHGTFGELNDCRGNLIARTVECPWQNNQKNISCIPEGTYQIKAHQSPRFGHCLSISSPSLGVTVTGPSLRTHCLIHVANRPSELKGCIAPGEHFGAIKGEWGVLSSSNAMAKLLALIDADTVDLLIKRQ